MGRRATPIVVKPQPIERTVRDPDDDSVIATALAARADVIVSGDKDLLVLHPWGDVLILDPGEALNLLMQAES